MNQAGTMMTVQRVQGPVMAMGRMPNVSNTAIPNANIMPASQNTLRAQQGMTGIRYSTQQTVCSMGQPPRSGIQVCYFIFFFFLFLFNFIGDGQILF